MFRDVVGSWFFNLEEGNGNMPGTAMFDLGAKATPVAGGDSGVVGKKVAIVERKAVIFVCAFRGGSRFGFNFDEVLICERIGGEGVEFPFELKRSFSSFAIWPNQHYGVTLHTCNIDSAVISGLLEKRLYGLNGDDEIDENFDFVSAS